MILNQTPQKEAQLKLPDPADEDPHPRLLLEGDRELLYRSVSGWMA